MEANNLERSRGNARANSILKNHNKTEFEKKYKTALVSVLEKMIYQDVGANISALAETVKSIKPDETVDHSRHVAIRLMKKAMWATTSSVKYLFVKRWEYPPTKLQSRVIQFPHSAAKDLAKDLNKIISGMTSQDAAIFLGHLSGMYIKTCPKELFRDWRERIDQSPSTLFLTWTMEGELLMTIDY